MGKMKDINRLAHKVLRENVFNMTVILDKMKNDKDYKFDNAKEELFKTCQMVTGIMNKVMNEKDISFSKEDDIATSIEDVCNTLDIEYYEPKQDSLSDDIKYIIEARSKMDSISESMKKDSKKDILENIESLINLIDKIQKERK